jgi:arylsulfatase A-like enzyme
MMNRRTFLAAAGALAAQAATPKPNILWITCEDIGPELHSCGNAYSVTPNLDELATRSTIFMNAWSNAPVCAPARTTIISGMYAPATGGEHMRSMIPMPPRDRMYPQYLRDAGYYCTNNSKEDYNLEKPGKVWDESSKTAHWRNRPAGQPFFAIFNLLITHESQIRTRPHVYVHDPAKARVPAYMPDTPEVRKDWAQYYDNITTMDGQAAKILKELKDDGLEKDTIVFFYGDHGSGMPRSKRWPYNSGLNVCILLHVPDKYKQHAPPEYKPGTHSDRLVSFVDLAPTVIGIAGNKPPANMQGLAFAGLHQTPPRDHIHGFRGRMDERYDLVRSVRDKRYIYIRNYMPHKIYGQYIAFMFETPTTRVWRKLYDEGKLKPPQTYFWEKKPPEELYDLEMDRDEVNNLADSPQHSAILQRLKKAQRDHMVAIRDVGFLPEDELHTRKIYGPLPLAEIYAMAEAAASLSDKDVPQLRKGLTAADSAVRYWAALGFVMRRTAPPELIPLLSDPSHSVRAAAGEALGCFGTDAEAAKALDVLVKLGPLGTNSVYISMLALNAISSMGKRAKPALAAVKAMPRQVPSTYQSLRGYVPNLLDEIVKNLS